MVLTFLFTDIEGSTRLWETRRAEMEAALAAHDRALKRAVEQRRGNVFKTVGDAIFANFPSAADAILAAIDCQCAIAALEAPLALKIRVAVHSGDAEARDNDFFGPVMNRTARLLATAHGTQVVVSSAAYELARDALPSEVEVLDLGEHRLKDLTRPERIFQIRHSTFVSSTKPPASLSQAKHNLPIQTTRFIGRESQLHEVQQAIRDFRLVTLCGPGGAGKTRLGLQTASEAIDDFPDGVWLAELAPLREPSGVLGSVLDTLGATDPNPTGALRQLAEKRALLLLDNCEHVVAEAAAVAETIIASCAGIKVLATSREPLNLGGERLYRLRELGVPPAGHHTVADLDQFEAVQLFLDRVRLANPDFAVNEQNAPAIAGICSRLDGIPLAIELAAARIRALSPQEVYQRLGDAGKLLTGGARTATPRQQTLSGAIAWSYDLLSPAEQVCLNRVSLFVGTWSLESATDVAGDGETIAPQDVLDLVTSLSEKSLVVAGEGTPTRYRVLETIRQFAIGRLGDETDSAQRRRFGHFAAWASRAVESAEERHRLFRASADAQAALEWAIRCSELQEETIDYLNDLHHSCLKKWSPVEAHSYWQQVVSAVENQAADQKRMVAIAHAVFYASKVGATASARQFAQIGERFAAEFDSPIDASRLYNGIGSVELEDGNVDKAEEYYHRALEVVRRLDHVPGILSITGNLAECARDRRDYDACIRLSEEEAALAERHQKSEEHIRAIVALAQTYLLLLDTARANTYAEKALALLEQFESPPYLAALRANVIPNIRYFDRDPEAPELFQAGLKVATDAGDFHDVAQCLARLVELEALRGDTRRALDHARQLSHYVARPTLAAGARGAFWAAVATQDRSVADAALDQWDAIRARSMRLQSPFEDWNRAAMDEARIALPDESAGETSVHIQLYEAVARALQAEP